MALSEKIIKLRKQNGWSQEELAARLDVSRQSVSKWESASSTPDLDKIIKLSDIFGVSTDYLIKDSEDDCAEQSAPEGAAEIDMETPESGGGGANHSDGGGSYSGYGSNDRFQADDEVIMTLPETEYYLDLVAHTAKHIAAGVFACILSPVVLILLGGLSECHIIDMTDNMAGGIGMVVLLLIAAAAVLVFVMKGMQLKKYEYLERTPVRLDEDAFSLVISRKEDFESLHKICISIGVVLCIVSVIPLFVAAAFDSADIVYICCVDVLLFFAGIGVFLFVWSGMIYGSFCKLLEEGEYDRRGKIANRISERFSGVYWSAVSAIYLFISFLTGAWASTWIIWPCAGVLFGVLKNVMAVSRK